MSAFKHNLKFSIYHIIREFTIRNRTRYATVTILPEIELSHPIYGYDSNSLSKFRKNEEMKCQLIKYQSKSIIWPEFVYKMYDVSIACEKIKRFLTTLKIGESNQTKLLSEHLNIDRKIFDLFQKRFPWT